MLIIGHRGAEGLAPENTLSSLQIAQNCGAQMLEGDLRKTKDGRVVIIHDRSLRRTHHITRKVSQLTLSELKKLCKEAGKEIPELSEFISVVNLPINLEIKVSGIERQVLDALKGFAYKVLITSRNPMILKKIRALDGNIDLGIVIGSKMRYFLPLFVRFLSGLKLYSVTVVPELVTIQTVKLFKKQGWKIFVYTINDPQQFEELKRLKVDGVFTDYPNILSK